MSVVSEVAEQLLVEVILNGQRVGLLGGSEFRLLSIGVVRAHALSIPTLAISGLRTGPSEHTAWRSHRLTSGDKIGVICGRSLGPNSRVDREPIWPAADAIPAADFATTQAQVSVTGAIVATGRVEGDAHLQASIEFLKAVEMPRLQLGCMYDSQSSLSEAWLDVSFPAESLLELVIKYE